MRTTRLALVLLLTVLAFSVPACARGSAGNDAQRGRVSGRVLLGPMCPVESAASPCPDQPFADARVEAVRDGSVVATSVTDAEGRFSIALEPGTYVVRVALGADPARSSSPVDVSVRPGETTRVDLAVDTGIR